MKKFSPLVALIALAAAVAVGVVVGRNWPSAAHGEADKTAAATPGKTDYAAAASQPRAPVDTVAIPAGGFDPQQVQVAQVTQQSLPVELDTPGKLAYNAEHTKLASARVAGRLDRILVFEGALVREGQPLAELYAPDYISAQKEYLLALNTARTLQGSTMKDLQDDAQQTVQSAAGRLHVLGLTDAEIAQIRARGTPAEHLILRAPISGTIVKRNMDPGAFLNVGDSLMSIVDTRALWFTGNVYENDIARVRIGQPITLRTAAYPDRAFTGTVSFIAPNIDAATHTLTVRCDVPNPDGLLRPEMYSTARIQTGQAMGTVVPKTALVKDHGRYYVIVQSDAGHFRRTEVQGHDLPGADAGFAVTGGLSPQSAVVVRGAALLNEMIVKAGA
ncbi:efflux RND transporter periplasmic adaptor subunit [Ralstonia solanacearum]|uniref:Putative cation efflux system protein, CzcB or CusB protein n=1 Tax=Ralstonia solanacearum CFBP2957 TaxID=859656 RepID=D8P4W9_RALSL|nr:efflux RND transporter periplasmic adaptor subunit [Ralstonia solanacearum]ATJ88728.1 efflux RND transporter periplasmic adaptor subunit [Ralstonia solanacearum]MDB0509482.1 efflux RND transporter periplasmic adaptor subunit [Ralstonia solanacearum]MDB0566711.1 efflux RND transporter periplasmic adaptor subunit [Ralstonia solanacearum]MDB0576244.1 efflux RND transporter periplasmic adaptor subunit [Ralstonia solanacearum]OAI62912.1 RND transporter MFP subunit [Ralstonia solanacearum]